MSRKQGLIAISILLVLSLAVALYFAYQNNRETEAIMASQAAESLAEAASEPPPEETTSPLDDAYRLDPPVIQKPDVIEDSTTSRPEDALPPPDVTETQEADGTLVQTPNWNASKELAAGTDLTDPTKQPEYVTDGSEAPGSPGTSGSPSSPSSPSSSGASGTPSTPGGTGTSSAPSNPGGGEAPGSNTSSTPGGSPGGTGTGTGGGGTSTPQNGEQKTINGERYMYVEGFGWVKDGGDNEYAVVDAPTTGNTVGY